MKISLGKIILIIFFLALIAGTLFNAVRNIKTIPVATPVFDPFGQIDIEAKSAIVYDLAENKILYQKNPGEQLPLASLTKIMTALVATDMIPDYTTVTIPKNFVGDRNGPKPGEKWQLSDLIDYTLTISSNAGADAIAQTIGTLDNISSKISPSEKFIARMNTKARDLGLTKTFFLNESGLDINSTMSGGYSSVSDVAKIFSYILINKPNLFEATKYKAFNVDSESKISHLAINTNKSINDIPGLIASKTGLTDLSGGNLVIAFDAGLNHPIIVAVLGSSEEGRFIDVEKLVKASTASITEISQTKTSE